MILVTGASGHIGQGVVKELLNNNVEFVAGVRNPETYHGIECALRAFDYDDTSMMQEAFRGVDTVIFISGNAETERRIEQHRQIIDAAKQENIQHIVYLSFITVTDPNSVFPFTRQHIDTENYLNHSGIKHTVIRSSWYMENLEFAVKEALDTDIFIDGSQRGALSFISRQDVAKGLAMLAIKPELQGEIYTFTGSKAYAMRDVAELMNCHCGKGIEFKSISIADYQQSLIDNGLPEFLAESIALNSDDIDNGDYAIVSQDAKLVNQQQPMALVDYLTSICAFH
ncbi:NAD(P)H-binding protein [Photobacterium damselae]|nr:NAD(P)H-binding protein [Photobacterium damselae]ELI6448896.1 NAD(P)H-binding protein [Photobacterium damselae]KAB1508842.1 NAD(P)H-binding protein [Photobacterium damselae subsp. damselae]NVH52783.1 NAD(P)H-binding protein [Photobacterium damselae subsp. damselae]NVO81398.1 NAD(P)H-binding protein [Photobacterium damselae subsp. damselae]OBU43752.1 hypothetical protein AYY27_03925 [Photobacterium damselae]